MTFAEIAKDVRVSVEEVEHVVMKALSLGLVRGSIDEVDEAVLVSSFYSMHFFTNYY